MVCCDKTRDRGTATGKLACFHCGDCGRNWWRDETDQWCCGKVEMN